MKISIITIVFNDEVGIINTLKSLPDTIGDVEYELIIKDGASSDNTLNGIEENLPNIKCKVVSSNDSGIYNAMNIAIELISDDSDYTIFMNSGDTFTDDAFKLMENLRPNQSDVITFPIASVDEAGFKVKIRSMGDSSKLMLRPYIPHQSTLVRSTLLKEHYFDERFRILADYDLFCRLYNAGHSFEYVNSQPLALFLQGGVSSAYKSQFNFAKEQIAIQKNNFKKANYCYALIPLAKWLLLRFGFISNLVSKYRRV
ncbi:glycosyltransferase [Vibrio metschnikovii]|nr:glycosyltransferase [Vibrio metschnikovii]